MKVSVCVCVCVGGLYDEQMSGCVDWKRNAFTFSQRTKMSSNDEELMTERAGLNIVLSFNIQYLLQVQILLKLIHLCSTFHNTHRLKAASLKVVLSVML